MSREDMFDSNGGSAPALALADAGERRRIIAELDRSFLVEAAAGTGKTTVLVDRIVGVLARGLATIDEVVAVTFSERAAAELKLRLRERLETALFAHEDRGPAHAADAGADALGGDSDASTPSERDARRGRMLAALRGLELAQVSTIHAFCGELLRAHPVEAGVDPRFRVLGEGEQNQLRRQAFDAFIQRHMDAPPPGMQRLMRWPSGRRGWVEELRAAADDLIEHRDFDAPWRRPEGFVREEALAASWDLVRQLALERPNPHAKGLAAVPSLALEAWQELKGRARALGAGSVFELDDAVRDEQIEWAAEKLRDLRREIERKGRQRGPKELAELVERFLKESELTLVRAEAELAALLRDELAPVVSEYTQLSFVAGEVDMVEPLLRTRNLLRGDPQVRRSLQERYRYVFVDEVQDTDPLQAQILLLLCADDPAEHDWTKVRTAPGKLFLVGDPKQAIYRFRRADLAFYDTLKARVVAGGAEVLELSASFRARPAIQRVINASFARYFKPTPRIQPGHVPLSPVRLETEAPSVVMLSSSAPYGQYRDPYHAQVNESAAADVPRFVDWLLHESGFEVEGAAGELRPVAPGDIALLFRNMTSWGQDLTAPYRELLEERGVPYALAGGSGLYERAGVIALLELGAALEYPDDRLKVWSTLRGPLFAHDDATLYLYSRVYGAPHPLRVPEVRREDVCARLELDPSAAPPGSADDPVPSLRAVAESLRLLRKWHLRRNRRTLPETFEEALAETRARFTLAQGAGGAQVLANIERLLVDARSFESNGATSFRSFLEFAAERREARGGSEGAASEADEGSVRIMTVHKAKGLEFPVVILCHPASASPRRDADHYSDPERALRVTKIAGCRPLELSEHAKYAVRADHAEAARLTYVAATRARDLLVVPATPHVRPPFRDAERKKNPRGFMPGWVAPLNHAVYPALAQRPDASDPAGVHSRAFSQRGVRIIPDDPKPGIERILPGRYGDVLWWDANALPDAPLRSERPQMSDLLAEGSRSRESAERFVRWSERRARARLKGSRPTQRVETVTEAAQTRSLGAVTGSSDAELGISVLRTAAQVGARPRGARFGTLVHRVLADVAFDAGAEEVARLVTLHGRLVGASEPERAAAAPAVLAALAHDLLRDAAQSEEVLRESPVMLTLDDGTLVEGTIDLAFLGGDDPFGGEPRWVVVDYKTDLADGQHAADPQYQTQIALYARALEEATGVGVDAVILGV